MRFFAVFVSDRRVRPRPWRPSARSPRSRGRDDVRVRVRMGLHTGEAALAGDEYVGIDVHRVARIAAAGHGGQVLLSGATRAWPRLTSRPGSASATSASTGSRTFAPGAHPPARRGGLPDRLPADAHDRRHPNNLPIQLTSFVGRDASGREARRLLRHAAPDADRSGRDRQDAASLSSSPPTSSSDSRTASTSWRSRRSATRSSCRPRSSALFDSSNDRRGPAARPAASTTSATARAARPRQLRAGHRRGPGGRRV